MKKALIILPVVGLLLVTLAVAQVSQDISVTAEVQPYYSVVFNYNAVDFGAVALRTNNPAPGNAEGLYNVSIDTNVQLKVKAYRTPWSPEELVLKFASSVVAPPSSPEYEITTTPTTVVEASPIGAFTHYHAYWLDVPYGAPPGFYTTTVTITYQPA